MKKAVLVGINYPKTNNPLRGCINDVNTMENIIVNEYGFTDSKKIRKLIDKKATAKNILKDLRWLVRGSKAGDVLFFHYSGHGSQLPSFNPLVDYEPDGLDEVLCPIDLDFVSNMIRDDDFKRIVKNVPKEVNLTVILDCCHSGDGLRGIPNPVIDNESTSRFLRAPEEILKGVDSKNLSVNTTRLQNKYEDQVGILISGCKSNQTSADTYIDKKFQGACTYMLALVLKNNKYDIDYESLVNKVNRGLKPRGFMQNPELNCATEYKNLKFLEEIK